MSNWKDIWKNRKVSFDDYSHANLFKMNGYDGVQADLNPENVKHAIDKYESLLLIDKADSIYDVGCGSGAFLYTWGKTGHGVGGCDLSPNLVTIAKNAMPSGEWTVCEGNKLRVRKRFDHVVAFGSFFYFPDYEYARETLYRMMIKAKKTVSVFDVPDMAKMEDSESARRAMIPDYDEKYKETPHLYYQKDWWMEIAMDLGVRCYIYEQDIPGYLNSQWRYNVSFWL